MSQENLEITKGDDKTYTLTFTDENGTAIDITGWTIFFTAKKNYDDVDDDAVISKDVTTHTNPTGGITQIALSNSDTSVSARTYKYDIQVKTDENKIYTVVYGDLKILPQTTRRSS